MPRVYTLVLSKFTDAGTIRDDWETTIGEDGAVHDDYGGVTVAGRRAVIVSSAASDSYGKMADLDYVSSITESKDIPSREDPAFDAPVSLGHGIQLRE